jgi:hypothetical protein
MRTTHTRLRRAGGLTALLACIGVVVALKATSAAPASQSVALPPAVAPTATPTGTPTGTPSGTSPSGTSPSGAAPSGGPVPSASTAPTTKTVAGDVAQTPYGPVQVELVISAGRITDVQSLQLPDSAARSRRLAQLAAPTLRSEVLSAQSARIDTVSGATYTSDGYAESVQYALDHA